MIFVHKKFTSSQNLGPRESIPKDRGKIEDRSYFKPTESHWFFKFTIILDFSSTSIPYPKKNRWIKPQISDSLQKGFYRISTKNIW